MNKLWQLSCLFARHMAGLGGWHKSFTTARFAAKRSWTHAKLQWAYSQLVNDDRAAAGHKTVFDGGQHGYWRDKS